MFKKARSEDAGGSRNVDVEDLLASMPENLPFTGRLMKGVETLKRKRTEVGIKVFWVGEDLILIQHF